MNFSIDDEAATDGVHMITVGGDVDMSTAPELKRVLSRLIDEGKRDLLVDLSRTEFIDSTAIGVLVGGLKRVRPQGGSVSLVCESPRVLEIFEVVGLDRTFRIYPSREEALAGR